eukprot:maker-scaffold_57-snap-gene-1.6-mRNA-1 protein AED:0.06 eAED:0.06 QI:46/0.4/0.33/0.66/1/1/6/0/436
MRNSEVPVVEAEESQPPQTVVAYAAVQGSESEKMPEARPVSAPIPSQKLVGVPYSTPAPVPMLTVGNKEYEKSKVMKAVYLCGGGVCCFIFLIIVASASAGGNCNTVTLGEVINPDDYVQLIFSGCPSEGGLNAFTEAATRISAIVDQTELTEITLGADASFNDVCGNPLEDDVIIPAGFTFDSLVIVANTVDIDGRGGILAQAGPCAVSEEDLPILGLMTFDNADIDALEDDGTLDDVIMHEMLHVTGVGTLWNFNRNLLQDPAFDAAGNFNANAQPRFVGASGVSEFGDFGGNNGNGVPVEDGIINGQRVLDANNGRGSIDGHWDIDDLDNELMVFAIDADDAEHPLSRLTIGSLEDLGYEVDFNQADDFSVSAVVSLDKGNLRSSIATGKKGYVDLSNDLSKMPVKRAREELWDTFVFDSDSQIGFVFLVEKL